MKMKNTVVSILALHAGVAVPNIADGAIKTWQPVGGSFDWHVSNNWFPLGVPGVTDNAIVDNQAFVLATDSVHTAVIEVLGGSFFASNGHNVNVTNMVSVFGGSSRFGMDSPVHASQVHIGAGATLDILGEPTLTTNYLLMEGTATVGGMISVTSGTTDPLDIPSGGSLQAHSNKTMIIDGGDMFSDDDDGAIQALIGNVVINNIHGSTDDSQIKLDIGGGHVLSLLSSVWQAGEHTRFTLFGNEEPATLEVANLFNNGTIRIEEGAGILDFQTLTNEEEGAIQIGESASLTLLNELVTEGNVWLEGGEAMLLGEPVVVYPSGEIWGGGLIANQRIDNHGSFRSSIDGQPFIIDTIEPFDLDGSSDLGNALVANGGMIIKASAAPPVTVFHGALQVGQGGFELQAGEFVLASEGTVHIGDDGTFVAPSFSVAGELNIGVLPGEGIIDADMAIVPGATLKLWRDLTLKRDTTILNGVMLEDGNGELIVDETGTLEIEAGLVVPWNVVNHGDIAPGLGIAVLDIDGSYTQGASGTLSIDIGGTSVGTFDALTSTDIVILAGSINVSLVDGFVPQFGDTFDIITANIVAGSLEGASSSSMPAGLDWSVELLPNAVRLHVVESDGPTPDLNGDGVVGPGDLAIILGNWGPCPAEGSCDADLSGDGAVGPSDLAIVLGSWG